MVRTADDDFGGMERLAHYIGWTENDWQKDAVALSSCERKRASEKARTSGVSCQSLPRLSRQNISRRGVTVVCCSSVVEPTERVEL